MNRKDLIKKMAMATTYKPNYKDVGTCLRYVNNKQVFCSKFKTEGDAAEKLESLKRIGVANVKYVTFKCPECGYWHIGLKEWAND